MTGILGILPARPYANTTYFGRNIRLEPSVFATVTAHSSLASSRWTDVTSLEVHMSSSIEWAYDSNQSASYLKRRKALIILKVRIKVPFSQVRIQAKWRGSCIYVNQKDKEKEWVAGLTGDRAYDHTLSTCQYIRMVKFRNIEHIQTES